MYWSKTSLIHASAAEVFAFHERKDAFALLQPPWQESQILQPPTSLAIGTKVKLRTRIALVWVTIEAEHIAYEAGHMFADRMISGPFKTWVHRHVVTPQGKDASSLTDEIEYELPLGWLGALAGAAFARRELERLFEYRHAVTRRACETGRASGALSPRRSPEDVG